MALTNQQEKTKSNVTVHSAKKLEALMTNAIRKINGNKENDICKYLPVPTGGYMHHFTMRKMKTEEPEKLSEMIDEFIINVNKPNRVPPKPRASRGSRKRRDQLIFSKIELERLLNIARLAGDMEMIAKLTPRKPLNAIKKELIASVRHNRVEADLWNSYVETVKALHAVEAEGVANNFVNGELSAATSTTTIAGSFTNQ